MKQCAHDHSRTSSTFVFVGAQADQPPATAGEAVICHDRARCAARANPTALTDADSLGAQGCSYVAQHHNSLPPCPNLACVSMVASCAWRVTAGGVPDLELSLMFHVERPWAFSSVDGVPLELADVLHGRVREATSAPRVGAPCLGWSRLLTH